MTLGTFSSSSYYVLNGVVYKDDGCDVAPHCLECPLEQCRYDNSRLILRIRHIARDGEISRLRAEGASIKKLMAQFGLSKRSVHRILSGQQKL